MIPNTKYFKKQVENKTNKDQTQSALGPMAMLVDFKMAGTLKQI